MELILPSSIVMTSFDGVIHICDQITGGMVGTGAPYCLIGTAVCQGDRGTYYSVGMASNMSIAESRK